MSSEHREAKKGGTRLLWGIGVGLGALAAYNAFISWRTPGPSSRIGGYFDRYPARDGDLAYVVGGASDGTPLVLLHGLRPGDSMNQWRQSFALLGMRRPVYALDLGGFGLSSGCGPSVAGMADAIQGFLRDVVGRPAVLVAADGAASAAVLAAQVGPEGVAGVVLVCPPAPLTALGDADDVLHDAFNRVVDEAPQRALIGQQNPAQVSLWRRILEGDPAALRRAILPPLFGLPVVGKTLMLAMLSPRRLQRWARGHGFYNKERVDAPWLHEAVNAARHAALRGAGGATLSGVLERPWAELWRDLNVPCLLVWGRHAVADAHGGGLEAAPELLALRPDARLEVIDKSMLLPHVERPEAFAAVLERWLSTHL